MAKVKSPNYPKISLAEALALARKAFDKDNRNKMSQGALAKHLGHSSLSGPALTKIGAIRAYGLIEGAGDELRVSDDAVTAMMAPEGSPELTVALGALAAKPKLFQEIRAEFPTPPSAENLKFWLVKRKFAPDAAETATKSYLATLRLVAGDSTEYNSAIKEAEKEPPMPASTPDHGSNILDRKVGSFKPPAATAPMLQETFNLDEGPVTLAFPSNLTQESYEELEAALQLFLRRAKRRALWNDPAYIERRKAEVVRRANQVVDDEDAAGE